MDSSLDFQYIPLDSLSPNPRHPRSSFNQKSLMKLAESINAFGVLTPLLVVKTPAGFQIISGVRRFKAAKISGLRTIPCVILDVDTVDAQIIALIEDLEKEPLNILDLAGELDRLVKESDKVPEELSGKIGLAWERIEKIIKILDLPDKFKKLYLQRKLTAKELLKLAQDPNPLAITRKV